MHKFINNFLLSKKRYAINNKFIFLFFLSKEFLFQYNQFIRAYLRIQFYKSFLINFTFNNFFNHIVIIYFTLSSLAIIIFIQIILNSSIPKLMD